MYPALSSVVKAAEMIDAVVRDHLVPVMKASGFKKSARNWHRDLGEVVQVVNVQGSSWNDDDRAQFTINLGLWFPAVDEMTRRTMVSNRRPPEHLCTLRSRIGHLMPDVADCWWELRSEGELADVGAAAREALIEFGLPWLDRCAAPMDAFKYLRQSNYIGHSPVMAFALALAENRPELARAAYKEWRSQPDIEAGGPIDQWAGEHGLT